MGLMLVLMGFVLIKITLLDEKVTTNLARILHLLEDEDKLFVQLFIKIVFLLIKL